INYVLILYIFFFQAEDGIRDRNVTGVQTCALPISYWAANRFLAASIRLTENRSSVSALASTASSSAMCSRNHSARLAGSISTRRSEERRVGKECKSKWSSNY